MTYFCIEMLFKFVNKVIQIHGMHKQTINSCQKFKPDEKRAFRHQPRRTVCCRGWKSMLMTLDPWIRFRNTVFGRSSGEQTLGGCVEPEKETCMIHTSMWGCNHKNTRLKQKYTLNLGEKNPRREFYNMVVRINWYTNRFIESQFDFHTSW